MIKNKLVALPDIVVNPVLDTVNGLKLPDLTIKISPERLTLAEMLPVDIRLPPPPLPNPLAATDCEIKVGSMKDEVNALLTLPDI